MGQTVGSLTKTASSLTLGDVISRFQRSMDSPSCDNFTSKVTDAVNEVIKEMAGRYPWRWVRSSATIEGDGLLEEFPLPNDFAYFIGDPIIVGTGIVKRKSVDDLRKYQAGSLGSYAGTPRICALTSEQTVAFWPLPQDGDEIFFDYQKQLPLVSDSTDEILVPSEDQHIFLQGVRGILTSDDGEDAAATLRADRRYERNILIAMIREIDSSDDLVNTEQFEGVEDL